MPDPSDDPAAAWDDEEGLEADIEPLRRPAWWRWVAIVVVLALVVATPVAYALSVLLR